MQQGLHVVDRGTIYLRRIQCGTSGVGVDQTTLPRGPPGGGGAYRCRKLVFVFPFLLERTES